jgi:signal transduction histidine kinase
MLWFVSLALAGAVAGGPSPASTSPVKVLAPSPAATAASLLAAETRRVRAATPRVGQLIDEGIRRSRTFAQLITDVHTTDVIVYVEASFSLPPDVSGRILLAGVAGAQRYLRVQVRPTLARDQLIATIAHELRHALEVAGARTVVDEKGFVALYRRIGDAVQSCGGFDTEAARLTGRRVRDELLG